MFRPFSVDCSRHPQRDVRRNAIRKLYWRVIWQACRMWRGGPGVSGSKQQVITITRFKIQRVVYFVEKLTLASTEFPSRVRCFDVFLTISNESRDSIFKMATTTSTSPGDLTWLRSILYTERTNPITLQFYSHFRFFEGLRTTRRNWSVCYFGRSYAEREPE
jgi:hypothetical protein